jgi:hypothetical protein
MCCTWIPMVGLFQDKPQYTGIFNKVASPTWKWRKWQGQPCTIILVSVCRLQTFRLSNCILLAESILSAKTYTEHRVDVSSAISILLQIPVLAFPGGTMVHRYAISHRTAPISCDRIPAKCLNQGLSKRAKQSNRHDNTDCFSFRNIDWATASKCFIPGRNKTPLTTSLQPTRPHPMAAMGSLIEHRA